MDAVVMQLCQHQLLISTKHACMTPKISHFIARELLPTLGLRDAREVCMSLADGRKLRTLPKNKLFPALRDTLSEHIAQITSRKRSANGISSTQSTLTGLTPAQCLSNAILKEAGHCVRIPLHVLRSLQRVHFLFFLEDGHDSPNVLLADAGKVRFPSYLCLPGRPVFLSAAAYTEFESARELECELEAFLGRKDYEEAECIGSIAESQVCDFLKKCGGAPDELTGHVNDEMGGDDGEENMEVQRIAHVDDVGTHDDIRALCSGKRTLPSSVFACKRDSERSNEGGKVSKTEVLQQLKHPFFRRYTAQWVYARMCWVSVHALERLGEYTRAVKRLQLLLSTRLVPKRRGKCLNRLTINMFRHLGMTREPLKEIVDALECKTHRLNYGDRVQLAQRGLAIHKKVIEAEVKREFKTGVARKKRIAERLASSQPRAISDELNRSQVPIATRKILGKSLNVRSKERDERVKAIDDGWQRFLAENSRDSAGSQSATIGNRSILGKAKFSSLRAGGTEVTVEEYCLEWYMAREGWQGIHDEGRAVRFLFCLLLWESCMFKDVVDVFQTPYQDRPLDLATEAFYESRREDIERRLGEIRELSRDGIYTEIVQLFEKYEGTRAVCCAWEAYSADDLGCIGSGLGAMVLARCCELLSGDFAYWGGGLPDLILWRRTGDGKNGGGGVGEAECKLVEVKSARDALSERQRAWLVEFGASGANCEVCKVVERVTARNADEVDDAKVDFIAVSALQEAHSNRHKEE